jgi:hypothetical protein
MTSSSEIASAVILADAALNMIIDTATVLKDAGEIDAHQEFSGLADQASKAIEKLKKRLADLKDDSQPSGASSAGDSQ